MKMKKVLICSPSHAVYGGVETIVADLCRHLPTFGWQAILGLGKGGRFNDVERYRKAYPDLPALDIDGVRGTRQARWEGLREAIRAVRPDVVLIARVFDAYPVVSALKQRRGAPRLAVTIQAYEPHYLIDAWLYRQHIDLCVTSGEMLRKAVVGWSGLPEERVFNIPGGVRSPSVPVFSRSPGDVLRLGYVGRLDSWQKRIRDLIVLLELLEGSAFPYRLDVVGTGPVEAELRSRLSRLVNAGRVSFHGWLPRETLYQNIYPVLDCLVHFAHTEGVTIAPREAMTHGVVPVISRFVGLSVERHFFHEVNALTFPVGDVAAAAACVRRLFTEPRLLRRLSENAMQSQSGRYSFEGATSAWAEALDRCLVEPTRTGKLPKVPFPPDGRLTRLGVSPWMAQRVRDLLGRRHRHTDPGSEWPTGSGVGNRETVDSILRFAAEVDTARAETTILS
jgi:glycosyltransferase involved in cell wall biosynthesis